MTSWDQHDPQARKFADEPSQKPAGVAAEFLQFLRHNKTWWLAPIIILLLVIGAIVILGGTAAAPFIYPLQ